MIPRLLTKTLRGRLADTPAVALVGPRQCGKTTLARSLGGAYFDLEQEPEQLRLDLEWGERIAGSELLILDEVQCWPEVFPRLRGAIDAERRRNGRFLLLGSVSPSLMVQVSESLAGRLSLLELSPFLQGELEDTEERERLWLTGGFPDGGVRSPEAYPRWQRDYLSLLVQRDLPAWGMPSRPRATERLVRMLAACHGQVWNASQLGHSLGLSYHTVNKHVDYLEGAYLVRRLPPFHANLRKRLVRSPKLYWRDTGLLHSVLNVMDEHRLIEQPWVGASWEGFVIEQAIATLQATGKTFEAFWFRTSDGYELDLVLELEGNRWAVEVKLTTSPSPADLARLEKTAAMIRADRCLLVSRVREPAGDTRRRSENLGSLLASLQG